jgi:ParB family chromosome partitioning protein
MSDNVARRGLGRGLSALISEAAAPNAPNASAGTAETATRDIREAAIELLRRNPQQPRRIFSDAEIDELADSIREKGVLQPLLVRPAPDAPGEYQIVAGERRWRASQRAGLRVLPVVVRTDLDDLDVLEIGVIENVQRQDLKPLEEAEAYKTLIERFGRTQEEVAKTVGKSRSHVANTMRLLALPSAVHAALNEGKLSAGHARAIIGAPDPERLARLIVERDLSVRETEALARAAQAPEGGGSSSKAKAAAPKNADTAALEQDLSETLGLSVQILDRDGQGEVRIVYKSLEQLDALCGRLGG